MVVFSLVKWLSKKDHGYMETFYTVMDKQLTMLCHKSLDAVDMDKLFRNICDFRVWS